MIGYDLYDRPDSKNPDERINWTFSAVLFFAVQIAAVILPFFVGISVVAVLTAVFCYIWRMFLVTGFNHRYFAHRTFKIKWKKKYVHWIVGFLCTMEMQKGVLWWAYWHRHHHEFSDTPEDVHSRKLRGFWWSHIKWILVYKFCGFKSEGIEDLMSQPELVWFEKGYRHLIGPVVYMLFCAAWGAFLEKCLHMHTNAWQMIVWAGLVSTTLLWHGTFSINSFAHMVGKLRFKDTKDESRNSWVLAIITLGEGFHNNHHKDEFRVAQALAKWEYYLDFTYWGLKALEKIGIIEFSPAEARRTEKLRRAAGLAT